MFWLIEESPGGLDVAAVLGDDTAGVVIIADGIAGGEVADITKDGSG